MKKYCKEYLTETHIWTSIHHPQTMMGNFKCSERTEKISNTHRLRRSTDHEDIDRCISVYVMVQQWKEDIPTTKCYPEERYSGQRDSVGGIHDL